MRRFLAPIVFALTMALPPFAFAACDTITPTEIEMQTGSAHRVFKGAEARTVVEEVAKLARAEGITVHDPMPAYDEVRVYVITEAQGMGVAFQDSCGRFAFTMPLAWYAKVLQTLTAGR
jgi:hypothetical protein